MEGKESVSAEAAGENDNKAVWDPRDSLGGVWGSVRHETDGMSALCDSRKRMGREALEKFYFITGRIFPWCL